MDIEKFKEKNKEPYVELDSFLELSKDNIRYIVCTMELGGYITENDDDVLTSGMWLWNDRPMIPNPYQSPKRLDFILKDNTVHTIGFFVPCVCGIYEDEKHP